MNIRLKKHSINSMLILLILILSGCSHSETTVEVKGSAMEIAAFIADRQTGMPNLTALKPEDAYFDDYLKIYGLDKDLFSDAAIAYADGAKASEISVFVVEDGEDVQSVEDALLKYQANRIDSFRGYVPDQAALAEKGFVVAKGPYVALVIGDNPESSRQAFENCFSEDWTPPVVAEIFEMPEAFSAALSPTPLEETTETSIAPSQEETVASKDTAASIETTTVVDTSIQEPQSDLEETSQDETVLQEETRETLPPETTAETVEEDAYDAASILAVWRGGDIDSLTDKNRAVYDAAVSAIDQVITEDMSDYDKELAIHDYILSVCTYDTEANNNAPDAAPDPDNDNPYGTLINGVGICWGYTYTFQLFMDMLDITCISIGGSSGSLPHAWNMVQVDGEWYCVDVTWDDSNANHHRYFNVTSQFMRDTKHQWDENGIPVATAK